MIKKKHVDPIPDQFADYDEAAEFWDTHDTIDYLGAFRTVEVKTRFRSRRYEIEVEEDVVKTLQVKARRKKITVSHLASDLLRQQLAASK